MLDNLETRSAITSAALVLEQGGLVAFPTETVYGLGADAENPTAINAVYTAKGRPANHPLIVHLAIDADPGYWSSNVSASAQKLIAAFWPGPLTLILPRNTHIPAAVSGGQPTIGLRCPAHPVAQRLLQTFKAGKGGIAAPSANRFGHVSPTIASHVREEFQDSPLVRCVLEGGQSEIGIESTILDLTSGHPVLLRPGSITSLQIAELLGELPAAPGAAAPQVSGSLASHYAPRTPLAFVSTDGLPQLLADLWSAGRRVALMHHTTHAWDTSSIATPGVLLCHRMPSDPGAYAHDLYAVLRHLDHVNAEVILVEALADIAAWGAVRDRLARATHGSDGILRRLVTNACVD